MPAHKIEPMYAAWLRGRPPDWLLPALLRRHTLHTLLGRPFAGKSILALSCALSLTMQRPFLHPSSPRAGRCLYWAVDGPDWDYKGLVRKLGGSAPAVLDASGTPRLLWVTQRPAPLLDTPSGRSDFLSTIRNAADHDEHADARVYVPPDLVVLDCWRDFVTDENDSNAVSAALSVLKEVAAESYDNAGCAFLVLVHPGKQGRGIYATRGSSRIADCADVMLELKAGRGGLRVLEWHKARGGDLPMKVQYRQTSADDAITLTPLSAEEAFAQHGRAVDRIVALLTSGPQSTAALVSASGLSQATVYRVLREKAVKSGREWSLKP